MPSSTSSFDERYQTTEPGGRLRVALQTLGAGIIVFGGTLLIYHGLLHLLYQAGGDLNGRMVAQIEHLPDIVSSNRDKQKVFVFGSSMVQAGFEPTVFDAVMRDEGLKTISYNYGVGNLNPEFQELISRRISEQFIRGNERLALTLIEFNPFQATKRRNTFTGMTRDQNVAVLASDEELWQITLNDPTRGIRLFTIRYLRDGISAELITSAPAIAASVPGPDSSEEYQAALKRRAELGRRFEELRGVDAAIGGSAYWDVVTRGGRIDKSSLSPEALEALGDLMQSRRYSGFMRADLQRRVSSADILELRFDDAVVESFIAFVRNFLVISDEVEVILLPRNTDWVNYKPDAQQRLNRVLRQIESETGVKVRDFQVHPRISPEHFSDTTHLSSYDGIDIFTALLAREYADVLRDQ